MSTYQKKTYEESEAVKAAKSAYDAQTQSKPAAYTSANQPALTDTLSKIQNRKEFSYDPNSDPLYQSYKDLYTQQGRQAMLDTVGKASALTGGYGNSYAQTAGQQTYQGYLTGLNDQLSSLYQTALNKYQQEGTDLYNQYTLLADQENRDYSRYRDAVSDYNAETDRLYNTYLNERDYDYNRYTNDESFAYNQYVDDRNYAYQQQRDAVSDAQWQQSFDYQQARDAVSDSQWQAQFDEAKRQYDQSYAADNAASSGSSYGTSSGTGLKYDNGSLTDAQIITMQKALGVTADGKWGSQSQAAALKEWGVSSADEAMAAMISAPQNAQERSNAIEYMISCGVPGSMAYKLLSATQWRQCKINYPKKDESQYDSYDAYMKDFTQYNIEVFGK